MSAKKKVLLVTDYFYPHWTGISKAMLNMVDILKDEFDFTILTVRFDTSLPYTEKVKGASIIREDYAFSLSRAKYSFNLVFKAISEVPKHDIVFINSPNTNILPITLIAKIAGKPVKVFHQGDLTLPGGFKDRIIEALFDFSTHLSFSMANGVSTYTKDYAENSRVLSPYMKKFTPLLMPFLIAPPQKKITNKNLLKLQKLKDANIVVLGFAGRFVSEKGFDILFKAIPKIKSSKQYIFAFAGETNMQYEKTYENLQKLMDPIKDKLLILGLLNEEELTSFYKLIDYIVMPSRSDCFPLVQAEATLAGAPSICASIPGARVLVKETGFGVLFEKENSDDLANVLSDVINSRPTFKDKHEKVERLLDIKTNAKKIANYIRQ